MDDTATRAQAARATCPYLTTKQTAFHLGIAESTLTSIDRSLLRGIGEDRVVEAHGSNAFDQAIRAGRLAKLGNWVWPSRSGRAAGGFPGGSTIRWGG